MRFHRHRWRPFRAEPYRDVSYGKPGILRTCIYMRCEKCQQPKVEHIDGAWHLADLLPAEGGEG